MTLLEDSTLIRKKVLVFDLDGTIVRLAADWYSLLKALNTRYFEKYKEKGHFDRMSNLLSSIVARRDEKELQYNFSIIQQYELENITKSEPIKDVIHFINNIEESSSKISYFCSANHASGFDKNIKKRTIQKTFNNLSYIFYYSYYSLYNTNKLSP